MPPHFAADLQRSSPPPSGSPHGRAPTARMWRCRTCSPSRTVQRHRQRHRGSGRHGSRGGAWRPGPPPSCRCRTAATGSSRCSAARTGALPSPVLSGSPSRRPGGSTRCSPARPGESGQTAIIEMSQAAGLVLAGGAELNDPVAAGTAGVGELIEAAVSAGAQRLIVGCGGSATTDGGTGALSVLGDGGLLAGVELIVAYDVDVPFLEAAAEFRPPEGSHSLTSRPAPPAPRGHGRPLRGRLRHRRASARGRRSGGRTRRRTGGDRRETGVGFRPGRHVARPRRPPQNR